MALFLETSKLNCIPSGVQLYGDVIIFSEIEAMKGACFREVFSAYRYGFNGMEKDDEVKGSGNSMDFGARIYDSRLGRWLSVDPKHKLQPAWSSYKFALNNPLIFVDPQGETEFYYKGKWVGSDGVKNGIIGIVGSKQLKKDIKRSSKNDLNYNIEGIGNGSTTGGVFGIHKDVLSESMSTLNKALINGLNKEFTAVMEENENGGFNTTHRGEGPVGDWTGNFTGDELPAGDISIHSHPTGSKIENGVKKWADAEKPTNPGDQTDVFPNYDMNIIVGKNGEPGSTLVPNGKGGMTPVIEDMRGGSINVYNRSGEREAVISERDAGKILKDHSKKRE